MCSSCDEVGSHSDNKQVPLPTQSEGDYLCVPSFWGNLKSGTTDSTTQLTLSVNRSLGGYKCEWVHTASLCVAESTGLGSWSWLLGQFTGPSFVSEEREQNQTFQLL